ncbi:MAG: Omp28 family outer membrane lipoprotein [Bacteroidaceae bacterium]|nr:Omp28 family outer membrane lipoprotein [Bacteroidaceae bacterium]
MKTTNPLFFILCSLFLVALAACSDIKDDERLIYVEPVATKRVVMIEDFTGQRCANCPKAAETIESLIEAYGEDKIVPVAIHCDPMGFAGTATVIGLMSEVSRAYGKNFNVQTQPIGTVNRIGGLTEYTSWADVVREAIQKPTYTNLSCTTAYDEQTKEMTVTTQVTANDALDARLQVMLLQDSIVAMQTMPNGKPDNSYMHNHVFRDYVNGDGGESVTLPSGGKTTNTSKIKLDNETLPSTTAKFVPANCYAVSFLYDANGIIQVTSSKIK